MTVEGVVNAVVMILAAALAIVAVIGAAVALA